MRSGCTPAEPYPHGCNRSFAVGWRIYTDFMARQRSLGLQGFEKMIV